MKKQKRFTVTRENYEGATHQVHYDKIEDALDEITYCKGKGYHIAGIYDNKKKSHVDMVAATEVQLLDFAFNLFNKIPKA